jgi:hypothetical protein
MHASFLSTEMASHIVVAYLKVETRKIQAVLRPDENYRSLYPDSQTRTNNENPLSQQKHNEYPLLLFYQLKGK